MKNNKTFGLLRNHSIVIIWLIVLNLFSLFSNASISPSRYYWLVIVYLYMAVMAGYFLVRLQYVRRIFVGIYLVLCVALMTVGHANLIKQISRIYPVAFGGHQLNATESLIESFSTLVGSNPIPDLQGMRFAHMLGNSISFMISTFLMAIITAAILEGLKR